MNLDPSSPQRSSSPKKRIPPSAAPIVGDAAPEILQAQLDLQERQLVATTFANLELSSLKKALAQYVDLYDAARQENERLQKEMKERDIDSLQVLEYLRVEVAQKTTRLDEMERSLKAASDSHDELLRSAKEELNEVIRLKDSQLTAANATISNLQRELEDLSLFARERQEMLLEMDRTRDAYETMVNKYERELTKLRFQTIEEKVKLKAAETEMAKKFNAEVDARATILVDVKARSIHENNKNLAHDKALLEKEVNDLVTLATEVQAELKEAQRSAELDKRIQQEAMRHTAKLNKVARESDSKAQRLEARCHSMAAEHNGLLEKERAAHAVEVDGLKSIIRELRKQVEQHRHDLIRVRQLSATIVNQRSELENFFYAALTDVKQLHTSQRVIQEPADSSPYSPRGPIKTANWFSLTEREGGKPFSSTTSLRSSSSARNSTTPVAGLLPAMTNNPKHRVVPTPRDIKVRGVTPSTVRLRQASDGFTTSEKTGDPEEAPIPTLRDDDEANLSPPDDIQIDASSFSTLTWDEKELVIRSLLYFVNQSFYKAPRNSSVQGRENVKEETQQWIANEPIETPSFFLPSQLARTGDRATPSQRLCLTASSRGGSGAVGGVPPLVPKPPVARSKPESLRAM